MRLDETILQSNTCIQLVRYIKKLKNIIDLGSNLKSKNSETYNEQVIIDYNYIMNKSYKALTRRSRGFQVNDLFTKEEIKYFEELEKKEKEPIDEIEYLEQVGKEIS